MTETEKIQERFERGYTMAVYGTREAIHKQMWEDIRVLLCENKALSITAVSQAERTVCPDCGDKGWLYGDNNEKPKLCPCHY
jgi:hypothetical protein